VILRRRPARLESLSLTLPTRGLTGQRVIPSRSSVLKEGASPSESSKRYYMYMNMTSEAITGASESNVKVKWRRRTKAEWMADHAAMFDASAFKHDEDRRDSFLMGVERFFDPESANSWDGRFTMSSRSSTDDVVARSRYFREIEGLGK
jgi:hypothetical protein